MSHAANRFVLTATITAKTGVEKEAPAACEVRPGLATTGVAVGIGVRQAAR